ncbi:MAG: YkvA family protein [Acidobacteriota bacterium]|nr:YkvA family protein [Acidobacteriota bacterium]
MSQIQPTKDKGQMTINKSKSKNTLKNLLMFLPNMVKLLGRLLTDRRVPTIDKALFAAAIVYVIVPLDFIPDVFPFIGQVDDLYLVALTLLRLINHTDETVVRENWSGGGDIVSLANSAASLAPILLPKRVSRVLSDKVDIALAGKSLKEILKKEKPLAVKTPQRGEIEKSKTALDSSAKKLIQK